MQWRSKFTAILIAIGTTLSGGAVVADDGWDYKLALTYGMQKTAANWTLGVANNGTQPNIAEQYQLANVSSPQVSLDYRFVSDRQWLVKGSHAWLWPETGRYQHSQYNGNNATQEYSQLQAQVWPSDARTIDFAIGKQFRWHGQLGITPTLGYSSSQQNYKLRQGKYTLCDNLASPQSCTANMGTVAGFDSQIQGHWQGLQLGLDVRWLMTPGWTLMLDWSQGKASFDGKGYWNKQATFRQPLSQQLHARGNSNFVQLGMSYALQNSDSHVYILWHDRRYTNQSGTSYMYLTNGSVKEQKLAIQNWHTSGWKVGVQTKF